MKKIYYIYSILACLFVGILSGCTADELEKDQPRDFSKVKIVVNATLSGYEGEEKNTTKLTESGAWEVGDVIYLCVAKEANTFTLTYQGGGEWKIKELYGGNYNEAFNTNATGTLTALYCSDIRDVKRDSEGKIRAETHGDVVFTKEGKYKWNGDNLIFTINLNQRFGSKMVIQDMEKDYYLTPLLNSYSDFGDGTSLVYLNGILDPQWDTMDSSNNFYPPSSQYNSTTKELTVWGYFAGSSKKRTIFIRSKDGKEEYRRTYNKSLNYGQKVTIKGPFGDEASEWKKKVNGNDVTYVVVKYLTNDDNSYKVLPPKLKLERIDGISVKLFGKDGEEIKFSGSDRATFTVGNRNILFPHLLYSNSIILGGSRKGTTFLDIKLPPYYELGNSKYEFEVTDANYGKRLQLYFAKDKYAPDDKYKPLDYYYYDDIKKGGVMYIKFKLKDKWLPAALRRTDSSPWIWHIKGKFDDYTPLKNRVELKAIEEGNEIKKFEITVKEEHAVAEFIFYLTDPAVSNTLKPGDFTLVSRD